MPPLRATRIPAFVCLAKQTPEPAPNNNALVHNAYYAPMTDIGNPSVTRSPEGTLSFKIKSGNGFYPDRVDRQWIKNKTPSKQPSTRKTTPNSMASLQADTNCTYYYCVAP